MNNFYLGGVPEEAEVAVLAPLEVNQGFTGCLELAQASRLSENSIGNSKSNVSLTKS